MELTLKLNGEEVLILCKEIRNWDVDFISGEKIAPPLLLKLFSVFNELVTDKGYEMRELPVIVSEKELWLMRMHIQPADRLTDSNPWLGINLMRKIHALILQANCDVGIEQLENDYLAWSKEQPIPIKKEEQDAAAESLADKNAGDDPAERSADQADKAAGTGQDLPGSEAKSSPKN